MELQRHLSKDLTKVQLAAKAGCSLETIHREIKRGKIHTYKEQGGVRIFEASARAYLVSKGVSCE